MKYTYVFIFKRRRRFFSRDIFQNVEKSKYVVLGVTSFLGTSLFRTYLWSKKVNAKQTDFHIKQQRYIWARKCSALSENPPKKHALWSSLIFLFKLLHILGRFLEKLTNFRVFWTLFWLNLKGMGCRWVILKFWQVHGTLLDVKWSKIGDFRVSGGQNEAKIGPNRIFLLLCHLFTFFGLAILNNLFCGSVLPSYYFETEIWLLSVKGVW